MTTSTDTHPGFIGRLRSRQSGHPAGLLGRIIGRLMVKDTAGTNDHALAKLNLTEPQTVLDIGFGQGRTASALVRAGHHVLGVDTSPTMVKQATARNRAACRDGRADLRLGDGVTIPFPDDSADAAITAHTLYFMPDPTATIADIARVLRPGGTLAIACRTSDEETPAWQDPNIFHMRNASEITAMLRHAGFDHIEHEPGDAPTHFVHLFVGRLAN